MLLSGLLIVNTRVFQYQFPFRPSMLVAGEGAGNHVVSTPSMTTDVFASVVFTPANRPGGVSMLSTVFLVSVGSFRAAQIWPVNWSSVKSLK